MFIHDALLEAIECGVTEMAARDLPKLFKRMQSAGSLEGEFMKVFSTIHNRISQTACILPGNRIRNRHDDTHFMPCEPESQLAVRDSGWS